MTKNPVEHKLFSFAKNHKTSYIMELVCEKYKERMTPAEAVCRHPQDYCKFRSSCLIRFLGGEKAEGNNSPQVEKKGQSGKTAAD